LNPLIHETISAVRGSAAMFGRVDLSDLPACAGQKFSFNLLSDEAK
jgi:hypothetical protein